MKEYKPNVDNLTGIVSNLYHAVTGEKPDEQMQERIKAGVEGLVNLYQENPQAFYALASVGLLEGARGYNLDTGPASRRIEDLSNYLSQLSGYQNKEKGFPGYENEGRDDRRKSY
ncbi:MAG: hypothetical protein KKA62_05220 [Nanoarchaeota archaeon]|nr:hypothetical protein [Nanoarchaeota archaeon]MBU1643696.1 hypothetical protein [Nanoarchaeota archaeon]MBU1977322.1 hypothetical protein [Nanoarchaeota archaeon]